MKASSTPTVLAARRARGRQPGGDPPRRPTGERRGPVASIRRRRRRTLACPTPARRSTTIAPGGAAAARGRRGGDGEVRSPAAALDGRRGGVRTPPCARAALGPHRGRRHATGVDDAPSSPPARVPRLTTQRAAPTTTPPDAVVEAVGARTAPRPLRPRAGERNERMMRARGPDGDQLRSSRFAPPRVDPRRLQKRGAGAAPHALSDAARRRLSGARRATRQQRGTRPSCCALDCAGRARGGAGRRQQGRQDDALSDALVGPHVWHMSAGRIRARPWRSPGRPFTRGAAASARWAWCGMLAAPPVPGGTSPSPASSADRMLERRARGWSSSSGRRGGPCRGARAGARRGHAAGAADRPSRPRRRTPRSGVGR